MGRCIGCDELGMQWEPAGNVEVDGKLYFEPGIVIHPTGGIGGGISQLHQWRDIATSMGVEIRYDSRVRELLGNDRRLEGVRVSGASDGEYEIRAGADHTVRRRVFRPTRKCARAISAPMPI